MISHAKRFHVVVVFVALLLNDIFNGNEIFKILDFVFLFQRAHTKTDGTHNEKTSTGLRRLNEVKKNRMKFSKRREGETKTKTNERKAERHSRWLTEAKLTRPIDVDISFL